MNYKYIIIIVGLILLSTSADAQFEKKAQVGMKFLSNPVAAEVIARGTAGINGTFNSNGIFWNPALTSLIKNDFDISLNHHQWIADISYNAIAASINAFDFGVVTLSGNIVNYGELYRTVRSSNDAGYEETGTFSPSAFVFGLGFAQKITDRFSYGVNLKYIRQDLGAAWISSSTDINDPSFTRELKNYALDVFALDIGTYYNFNYKGISFAATLSNISQEKKYENEEFPLPFSVNFGGTISAIQFIVPEVKEHDIILMFESHHPRDFGEKLKFGFEYDYIKMIYIRAGYVTNLDERNFTAGVGFRKELADINLRVDYAYQNTGIFGDLSYFTVGMGF